MAFTKNVYASEQAARDAYLRRLLMHCGIAEGSTEHKGIVAAYNLISPRPRGHVATATDDWCAIFLCAIAWGMGYRDWPWECSVPRIVMEAKVRGIWHSGWADGAEIGQWVAYDLNGNGSADHIGCVVLDDGEEVWVAEGNYGNTVKVRRIHYGDERVLGFVNLPYGELVEEPDEPVAALRPGDSSSEVRGLQVVLLGAGFYDGPLDGLYSDATTAAVTAFQEANGLEPDGKCGPLTQAKIKSGDFAVNIAVGEEVESMEEVRYNTIEEVPEWGRATIEKLVRRNLLQGKGDGLDLSEDMVRMFVVLDRAGLYDA